MSVVPSGLNQTSQVNLKHAMSQNKSSVIHSQKINAGSVDNREKVSGQGTRPKSRNATGAVSQTIPIKANASGNKASSRSKRKLINAPNLMATAGNDTAAVKRATP